MFFVSEVKTEAPKEFKTELHKKVYETLSELKMEFARVDNDPAITMEDCVAIDERLDMQTVKTLFLCNRQQTAFYLFVTSGSKPFSTKDFSHALGVARVSFATKELLWDMMGVEPGAATVFSTLLDTENKVRVVFDGEVLKSETYGCTDGTTTGYMKIRTSDVISKLLPFAHHEYEVIDV